MKNNSNKIKICIISPYAYPLYNPSFQKPFGGGSAVQLFLLTKELVKIKGFNISLITSNYQKKRNKKEMHNQITIYKIIPIRKSPFNYIKGLFNFFSVLKVVNPDIIIQRAADKITGLCAFYCKLFKKKFIYSIASQTNVNGRDEKGFFGRFFKYGLNNASYIVAQNKDQIKKLKQYKRKEFKNIKVIKSGYNIKIKMNQVKKFILWVGRAIKLKRAELFLKLARKFPNEKFIMICYEEEYSSSLWEKIYREALKIPNLKFLKFVSFHEIDKYFRKAKVLINTSTYEGFPNTFIQALKNKTPILSLNVDPNNIIKDNFIGFFCNDSFQNLIKNLNILLENFNLYQKISNNCFIFAKRNHDILKITQNWVKLIEDIMKFN